MLSMLAVPLLLVSSLQAPTPAPAPDLTDPQVAHVAVTANSIDIDLAKFALTRAQNADVRKFAQTMITDHTAVNEQAAALAKKLGVVPTDNDVSRSLQSGASEARKSLERLRRAEFERAYVDREIAYHQAVLDAIDGLLIPTTENAELRKLLQDVRPAIAAHLAHAKQLRSGLGAGASK